MHISRIPNTWIKDSFNYVMTAALEDLSLTGLCKAERKIQNEYFFLALCLTYIIKLTIQT